MQQSETKHVSLRQAVGMVPDRALVAIGGSESARQPMALVREILRQGRTGLRLCGYRSGVDFEMLAQAGCAATIDIPDHTDLGAKSGAASTRIGKAAALARFEAGAAGLPFALVRLDPGELPQDGVFAIEDIAGQGPVTAVRRLEPDVALIHAHAADIHGNVQMDLEAHADFARDLALARASRHVIVSVEQIVSPQAKAPRSTVLAATEVDCVVEAPYGSYPLACENRYDTDHHVIGSYAEAMSGAADGFRTWLQHEVRSLDGHAAYLDRLGMRRLQAVTIRRSVCA